MEIIKPGVVFNLKNFKSDEHQRITFTHKVAEDTYEDGTTTEEVIHMLVERMFELQRQNKSSENATAIFHLKSAKQVLKKRTARKKQKKYGKDSDS